MKKYTLKLKTNDNTLTVRELKTRLETLLVRMNPPQTWRLGSLAYTDAQTIALEIASEGSPAEVQAALRGLEGKCPVTVAEIGWGWLLSPPASATISPNPSLDDPLAAVEPLAEPQKTWRLARSAKIRYLLFIGAIVTALVMALTKIYGLETSYSAVFPFMLAFFFASYALADLPFDIRLYAAQIDCHPETLEIRAWLGGKSTVLPWASLWGLDYRTPLCILHTHQGSIRLYLGENPGYTNRLTLLKTIVDRAALKHVESSVAEMTFRRFDAPA